MRRPILSSIAQIKRLLVYEFTSLHLCSALLQCFSALAMVFLVFFLHGPNLSLVFAFDEIVIKELIHLCLGYPVVLQLMVHAELTLVFLFLFFFFFCIFVRNKFRFEHLNFISEVVSLDFLIELRKFESIFRIFFELFGLALDELPFDSQNLPFSHSLLVLAISVIFVIVIILSVIPPKAPR